MPRTSGPGETAGEHSDAGDHDPCLGAEDCLLEVFGKTTISPEPSECSLDHPTSWLGLEGADTLAARDNFDCPWSDVRDRVEQLGATVDAIGKQVPQPGEPPADGLQQWH